MASDIGRLNWALRQAGLQEVQPPSSVDEPNEIRTDDGGTSTTSPSPSPPSPSGGTTPPQIQTKDEIIQEKTEEMQKHLTRGWEPGYYYFEQNGQRMIIDPDSNYIYKGKTISGENLRQRLREEYAAGIRQEIDELSSLPSGRYEVTKSDGVTTYTKIQEPGQVTFDPQTEYLLEHADTERAKAVEFYGTHPTFLHPAVMPRLTEATFEGAYESLSPEERMQFQEQFPLSSLITPEERLRLIEEEGSKYGYFEVDGQKKTWGEIKQEEPAAYLTVKDGQISVEIDPVRWREEQYEQMTPEGRLARIGALSIIRAVDWDLYAAALTGRSEEYIADLEYRWHKEFGIGTESPDVLRFLGTEGAVLSPPMVNVVYPFVAGAGLSAAFGGVAASGAVGAKTFMKVAPKILAGTIAFTTIEDIGNTLDRELKGIDAPGSTFAKIGQYGTMFGMAGLGAKTVQQYKPTVGLAEKEGQLYLRKHLTTVRGKPVLSYGDYFYVGEEQIGKILSPVPQSIRNLEYRTMDEFGTLFGRKTPTYELATYRPVAQRPATLIVGKGAFDIEKSLLENIIFEQQQRYNIIEFEPAQITKLTEENFLFDIRGKKEPITIIGKGKVKTTPEGELYSLYAGEVSVKTPTGVKVQPFLGRSESEELKSIGGIEVPSRKGVSYTKQKGMSFIGQYVDDSAKFLFDETRMGASITESELLKGGEKFLTYGKSKGILGKTKVPYSVRGEVADISEGKEFIPYADKGVSLLRHIDIGSLIDIPISETMMKQEPVTETKKPRAISRYETIPKEWIGVYDVQVVSETVPGMVPSQLSLTSMMGKNAIMDIERIISPQKAFRQLEMQNMKLGKISLNKFLQLGKTDMTKSDIITKYLQSPVSAKDLDILQIGAQIEDQVLKQATAQEQKLATKTILKTFETFSPKSSFMKGIGFLLPEAEIGEVGFAEITGEQGFIGQVRERHYRNGKLVGKGKFVDVHKRPKTKLEALGTAAEFADKNAAMTISVRKTKGKPVKGKSKMNEYERILLEFNNKGNDVFVEKRINAINSIGEIDQISRKGWEARSGKKVKRDIRSFGGVNRFERKIARLMKRGF